MSEDKPLHVQVSEALGCKPVKSSNVWWCPCGGEHGQDPDDMGCYHYDTDWSATGPLIEKYRFDVSPSADLWFATADIPEAKVNGWAQAEGTTPLVAVCHLILALKKAGKL